MDSQHQTRDDLPGGRLASAPAPSASPDRVTLWPLDVGRYGLDLTFVGNWGCEDAEEQGARLDRCGLPNTIRPEPDGGWTVRVGPLHSLEVAQALSSFVR